MNLSVVFAITLFSMVIGIIIGGSIEHGLILREAFENNGVVTLDNVTYKIEVLRSEQ